jgi:hypothetical protein
VARSALVVLSPAINRPGRGGDHPPPSKLEMRGAVLSVPHTPSCRGPHSCGQLVRKWLAVFGRLFSCAECKLQTGAVGCDYCLPGCVSDSDVSSRMHSGNYVYRLL